MDEDEKHPLHGTTAEFEEWCYGGRRDVVSDAERLLEIATRLMCALISSDHGANHTAYSSASCAIQGAEALIKAFRERIGAQGRGVEQDVSDELLDMCIASADVAEYEGTKRWLIEIQRARVAAKRGVRRED